MKSITSKKGKGGYYRFYLGKKDVTGEWMWFFSGLSPDDEERAVELFIKAHTKGKHD